MKCFSSQPGSAELAPGLKNNNPGMSSGYQLHKFKKNMFQRQILFQIKVIAETWCQLCLELSQPCLRALRNSPFIHWEVATNCACLQATKMLYCKETQSPSEQTAIAQFCKQDRRAQPPKGLSIPKRVKYSYSISSPLLPCISSSWTVFTFTLMFFQQDFPSTAPCWTDHKLAVSKA